MNLVEIRVEEVAEPAWLGEARDFALRALALAGKEGWVLSILICGDATIQALNRDWRGKDEPTDVLSFEQGLEYREEDGSLRYLAGDIAISLGGLARNVANFGVSEEEELERLLVHGILHLSGLDHATNDATEPMLMRQEEILLALAAGTAS